MDRGAEMRRAQDRLEQDRLEQGSSAGYQRRV